MATRVKQQKIYHFLEKNFLILNEPSSFCTGPFLWDFHEKHNGYIEVSIERCASRINHYRIIFNIFLNSSVPVFLSIW